MVDLPPELWHQIIRFLPPASVQALYGVNRTFFDVAMNEKYRQVALKYRNDEALRTIRSLLNPDIARRVKSLCVAPNVLDGTQEDHLKLSAEKSSSRSGTILGRIKRQIITRQRKNVGPSTPLQLHGDADLSSANMQEDLLKVVQYLNKTTAVDINWGALVGSPTSYLDSLWPTVSCILEKLSIFGSAAKLKTIFPFPVADFPRLSSLRVIIAGNSSTLEDKNSSNFDDVQFAIASFANSLQGSLQHLCVQCLPGDELPLFYQAIGFFPHLTSVDMNMTIGPPPDTGEEPPSDVFTFLVSHRSTLQQISASVSKIKIMTRKDIETLDHYQVTFPELHTFIMSVTFWTARSERMQRFLRDHASVIKSLEIVGSISPSELGELTTALSMTPSVSVLTKLAISIHRLDLSFLLTLARRLPGLKGLRLTIVWIANGTSVAFTPGQFFPPKLHTSKEEYDFVTEMAACDELRSWTLRDITIRRRSCCADLTLWNLMSFFAECIPTIASFADNGHMDIPDPPNSKPKYEDHRSNAGNLECFYGTDGASPLLPASS